MAPAAKCAQVLKDWLVERAERHIWNPHRRLRRVAIPALKHIVMVVTIAADRSSLLSALCSTRLVKGKDACNLGDDSTLSLPNAQADVAKETED